MGELETPDYMKNLNKYLGLEKDDNEVVDSFVYNPPDPIGDSIKKNLGLNQDQSLNDYLKTQKVAQEKQAQQNIYNTIDKHLAEERQYNEISNANSSLNNLMPQRQEEKPQQGRINIIDNNYQKENSYQNQVPSIYDMLGLYSRPEPGRDDLFDLPEIPGINGDNNVTGNEESAEAFNVFDDEVEKDSEEDEFEGWDLTPYEWIPNEVLDLDGSSPESEYFRKRENNFTKYHWDQYKIDSLWEASSEIEEAYGIEIDPPLLLSVIIAEGTGSFNTSSANKAADGGNGAESDYALDLMKANDLIFGKILGYIYYGDQFREMLEEDSGLPGIEDGGSLYKYLNWRTPIINLDRGKVYPGVYAAHSGWWYNVANSYDKLGGDTTGFEEYLSSIDKSVVEDIAEALGIVLPDLEFYADNDGKDWLGDLNGEYTICIPEDY